MNRDSGLAGPRQQLRLRLNLNQLEVGKAGLPPLLLAELHLTCLLRNLFVRIHWR